MKKENVIVATTVLCMVGIATGYKQEVSQDGTLRDVFHLTDAKSERAMRAAMRDMGIEMSDEQATTLYVTKEGEL